MIPDRPFFIAVASGKGGVGKTWLAITLSHAFARAGLQILLLDADLGLANVDVQLGLPPGRNLGSVLSGKMDIPSAVIVHPPTGLSVLAGRSGSGAFSELSVQHLDSFLTKLGRESGAFDLVLLDLGAGVDRIVRHVATWSDLLLLVATDEPTSLTDAYALVKLQTLDQPDREISVVINQAHSAAAGLQTYETLRRACFTFLQREIHLMGVIRQDPMVRDAIRHQAPLLLRHPNCNAAKDVEKVVETFLKHPRLLGRTSPTKVKIS